MITHAHADTHTFARIELLIQSADRETRQTTSIMASELIGNGGGEGGRGVLGLVEDFCNEV